MKCERCQQDKQTHKYEVDGFTGYLCEECAEAWDEISTE